jgi:coniferyl-aldehyde dehydrogenase
VTVAARPSTDATPAEVQRAFDCLREGYEREPYPDYTVRARRLHSLQKLVEHNEDSIAEAISADFGNRSHFETGLAEVFVSIAEIKNTLRHLRRWMRPKRVRTPIYMLPGRARIHRQPLGVVGIISPWNYPLFLSMPAVCGALAAGNRVLLKPSELAPRFSVLLRDLVAERFAPDELVVVTGGREVGEAVSRLPLNHLFFTGSTASGREIARAAADNLTPLTLELGGKSPAIIGPGADVAKAARSIAAGKLINAGQTCIAPDYCLVQDSLLAPFANAVADAALDMFPHAASNPDYASIISDRHLDRLQALIDGASDSETQIISTGVVSTQSRHLPLHIVVKPALDSSLMREEIFGPVLPIVPYTRFDHALNFVRRGPRPLAVYFFGDEGQARQQTLTDIACGGVTINDTLWHIAHPALPFGGIGASGIGAYHGEYTFQRFSHEKGVFEQSKWTLAPLLQPPYGFTARLLLRILRRLA